MTDGLHYIVEWSIYLDQCASRHLIWRLYVLDEGKNMLYFLIRWSYLSRCRIYALHFWHFNMLYFL